MDEDLSAIQRMRRELGEINPARQAHQTVASLSAVSARAEAPSSSLDPTARRNLYLLMALGALTALANPLLANYFATSEDWLPGVALAVLTWPVNWLQPCVAAVGAAGIGISADRSNGFTRLTRVWARVAQISAVATAIAAVGLLIVVTASIALLLLILALGAFLGLVLAGALTNS